jgi:hypothetical protein
MIQKRINAIRTATRIVFSERKYQLVGVGTFLTFLALYLFTLPATYTGGRIGMVSLRLLTPTLAVFAFIMAGLVGFIVPFMAYTLNIGGSASAMTTTSGMAGSVLPPLLCCSPLLPSLFAVVGAVFPAVAGTSGFVQGFIATYEIELLTVATLLLVYAVTQNAKGVTRCSV